VEGTLGWHLGGRHSLVRRLGECGAAAARAREAGSPFQSLEPGFAAEVADAVAGCGAERTLAFYFRRVFPVARARGALGDDPGRAAARLLDKRARRTGLDTVFADLPAFESFWQRAFPDGPNWRALPEEASWRNREGTWLSTTAEQINAFRDRHAIAVLLD